jgi:multidrug efflux pump subunit AcrA (membrane-fusion protein)
MRLFVVASGLAALLCLSAAITGQQNWTPAQKGNYGKVTRDALDRLLAAADKLQAGDRQGAKSLLQGMQSEVSLLTQVTGYFREQANREYGRCVTHIADLNTRVADLSNQEDALNVKIQDIEAQLVNIETRKQLTEEEIKKLRTSLSATEQLLAERRRKLHELEKWWWVPFYGAYLAIRTTVDNDIGNYNSLRNTLIDSSRRLSVNMQELQTIT